MIVRILVIVNMRGRMKLKTYKELEKEFDRKVKQLQSECKHEKTNVMEHWWAIGHSSGYNVEVCEICNKTIRRIYPKITEDDKKYGKVFSNKVKVRCQNPGCKNDVEVIPNHPYFGIICSECQKKNTIIYSKKS